uniref:Large ribosomal subunit protein bL33c n=1 Tax=Sciadococcus taiwanensis TaxID=3028030 RepID=A0A9Y1I278_9RHOD|nr:ribosomal protein L33 [Sciadococcus taiwanensis]
MNINIIFYMAKNKTPRKIVSLECTECRSNPNKQSKGISRYTTTKNRKNSSSRLELKKFCTYCNTHTLHKETK